MLAKDQNEALEYKTVLAQLMPPVSIYEFR